MMGTRVTPDSVLALGLAFVDLVELLKTDKVKEELEELRAARGEVAHQGRRSCTCERASASPQKADHRANHIIVSGVPISDIDGGWEKRNTGQEAAIFPPVRPVPLALTSRTAPFRTDRYKGARTDRDVSTDGTTIVLTACPGIGRAGTEQEQC